VNPSHYATTVSVLLALSLAPLSAWLAGCACATGQACYDDAARRIAEGPTTDWSVEGYSFELAETYARGCELGHAPSCREALAFWRTRPSAWKLAASGEGYGGLTETVHVDPETRAAHIRSNLACLVAIQYAAAKRADDRALWAAVAREFPGTRAARLAEEAEDRLILAALRENAPLGLFTREVATARPRVLARIEAEGLERPLGGLDEEEVLALGVALRARNAASEAARRLIGHADDAAFAAARAANTEASLNGYLVAWGGQAPGVSGVRESVSLEHRRAYRVPASGDYTIEVRSERDVDLIVSSGGSELCRRTSSAATERCELTRLREGATLEIRVSGSGTASLEISPVGAAAAPAPRSGPAVVGRHVEAALSLLEVAQAQALVREADLRDSLAKLDRFIEGRSLKARSQVMAIRTSLADRVRVLDAQEALAASSPDAGLRFLKRHPGAPETAEVRRVVVRLLGGLVRDSDTAPYEAFLRVAGDAPEARLVKGYLATIERRQAAEEARELAESKRRYAASGSGKPAVCRCVNACWNLKKQTIGLQALGVCSLDCGRQHGMTQMAVTQRCW
jgi:hypothetical protein